MRAHKIENGKVVNTVVVDSLSDQPGLIAATHGGIGWRWDGQSLTPPVISMDEYNAPMLALLEELDEKTPRAVREALITGDKSRVIAIETEAATLRAQLRKA